MCIGGVRGGPPLYNFKKRPPPKKNLTPPLNIFRTPLQKFGPSARIFVLVVLEKWTLQKKILPAPAGIIP